jgi:putative membrane protein
VSGRNVAVVALVAVVVVVALIWLLSGGGMMGWGTGSGMMGWGGYGSSGSGGSGIVMLFVAAAAICGVICLGASLLRPSRVAATVPVAGSAGPLDILKERYARGELSREQYDQIRRELER